MHACMYVCMHVCMHAWMYVCMNVCMHGTMRSIMSENVGKKWKVAEIENLPKLKGGGWNWNNFKKCLGVPPPKISRDREGVWCLQTNWYLGGTILYPRVNIPNNGDLMLIHIECHADLTVVWVSNRGDDWSSQFWETRIYAIVKLVGLDELLEGWFSI